MIETLKDAFVQGRLDRDEFGAPAAPARRRPLARAAARSGGCAVIAAAAMWVASIADPDGPGNRIPFLAGPMVILATIAVIAALVILGRGVVASAEQRRSRGQLPRLPSLKASSTGS